MALYQSEFPDELLALMSTPIDRMPSGGEGGISLGGRLASIEDAIKNLGQSIVTRQEVYDQRLSKIERDGSWHVPELMASVQRNTSRLDVLERQSVGNEEVKKALANYRTYLLALIGVVLTLGGIMISNLISLIHK